MANSLPGGLGGLMKQVQKTMGQAQKLEAALELERVEGISGGGLVRAVATGKAEILEIKIKPEAVDPNDVELLEDLVVTAVREAIEKANALRSERMSAIMPAGASLPGLF
jgi:DNA-binding YbaB/EbfC family protein